MFLFEKRVVLPVLREKNHDSHFGKNGAILVRRLTFFFFHMFSCRSIYSGN